MGRSFLRRIHARLLLAAVLFAWLAGATWHGAMQVGMAFGEEVCTALGAKRVPGIPEQPAGKSCPLCAAFGAPAAAGTQFPPVAQFVPAAWTKHAVDHGAILPAAHLADLASRAPPRA